MTGSSLNTPRTTEAARPERWAPRAFTGEEISEDVLATILEAARWAPTDASPSWRVLYARRSSPQWPAFLDLLSDFNESWTKQAGALLLVVSDPIERSTGIRVFDAATSGADFALQASLSGWRAQILVGFDSERIRVNLDIPDGYSTATAVAIGRHGLTSSLPLAVRERPSNRRALSEIAFEGGFTPLADPPRTRERRPRGS